ncbi:MAG: hypothetical protein M5R36_21730 [Deltaproteobacteria bacterium]|nr:hypothetical protein [Deltaproteobacteria bacterium]
MPIVFFALVAAVCAYGVACSGDDDDDDGSRSSKNVIPECLETDVSTNSDIAVYEACLGSETAPDAADTFAETFHECLEDGGCDPESSSGLDSECPEDIWDGCLCGCYATLCSKEYAHKFESCNHI